MASNKNALIRYRTLDKCLQNRNKKWTLEDLIEQCSDALYEYEGKHSNVSKRTVQLDLQMMRSDKLGYNAPIEVYSRKYYRYEDPHYSITNIPLTEIDLDIISESVEMLKQFKNFSLFSELNGVIQKLEDKIYREAKAENQIIHLDKNEGLKGLKFLDVLYQTILKKIVVKIEYQSFKARTSSVVDFHAYILKEYNSRWFVVGRIHDQKAIMTFALDRIISVIPNLDVEYQQLNFNADAYYANTFGVTVLNDAQLIDVSLQVDRYNAPYILTKPLHHSQKLVGKKEDGSITIELKVHHNYELERLILGFGASVEVIRPGRLRRRMRSIVRKSFMNYNEATE